MNTLTEPGFSQGFFLSLYFSHLLEFGFLAFGLHTLGHL